MVNAKVPVADKLPGQVVGVVLTEYAPSRNSATARCVAAVAPSTAVCVDFTNVPSS